MSRSGGHASAEMVFRKLYGFTCDCTAVAGDSKIIKTEQVNANNSKHLQVSNIVLTSSHDKCEQVCDQLIITMFQWCECERSVSTRLAIEMSINTIGVSNVVIYSSNIGAIDDFIYRYLRFIHQN